MNEQTQSKKGYKKRRKFKALLNNRGIEWSEPSPGHFRIGDIVYFYRAKKYQKNGKWHAFTSHEEFFKSL